MKDDIGVCIECHSQQPDSYMIKSPFFHQGSNVPCKWCGGTTIIVERDKADNALKQSDRKRGT